jgi:hypothetical protein
MAAGQARRIDPSLAAKYHRLMVDAGKVSVPRSGGL